MIEENLLRGGERGLCEAQPNPTAQSTERDRLLRQESRRKEFRKKNAAGGKEGIGEVGGGEGIGENELDQGSRKK